MANGTTVAEQFNAMNLKNGCIITITKRFPYKVKDEAKRNKTPVTFHDGFDSRVSFNDQAPYCFTVPKADIQKYGSKRATQMHHDAHLKKLGVTDTIASLPAICRSLNFGKRFRELHGRALPVMQVGTAWRSLLRIPKDAIRINTTFGDHHHTGRIIHTQATFEENSWMLSHNYSDEGERSKEKGSYEGLQIR
jgi:hypothetical protein